MAKTFPPSTTLGYQRYNSSLRTDTLSSAQQLEAMAYHDRSFDADFELFGMTPRSNLGLEQGDGFSFDGADWNDPTGQDDLGSSTQDFAAFEVPSGPTYQMEVRNNQEGVFDVQKAHDVHTTSQYVPDVQPSLSMQQCQQPGLEGWRPFECTVQDFDEIVHRPSIVGNTHEGHGTGHNQSLSFQQMNRDLMEITSAVPTPQLYDHRNVARQRRCSAPWTPYTMPDTLYGTTPRVSPDTGAVFGSSIPVSNEQPLFPHGSSPVDQRVSMSYTRDPNGSESAKSYYGMSIDSVPVGHRRPSVSLSRYGCCFVVV